MINTILNFQIRSKQILLHRDFDSVQYIRSKDWAWLQVLRDVYKVRRFRKLLVKEEFGQTMSEIWSDVL